VKKPTPFGKYFLLERINVGGMAEVFRAKAFGVEGFERLVAVKRILPNIAEDKEFIRMFIEEAKLSVQLNHANIAQIFDLGVVDNAYYIALEHVHGRDLRGIFDRCRQAGEAMPIAQACFLVMKACEGLDYAHNKRDQSGKELSLVHRDVSPQNVLVSFEGEVKIIDFGIAKAAGKGSKTQAGILKGKFGYMSPEQVRGLPVDRRSDVFSAGIVLYELLTGERLFVGESDFSTLEKVRNVEILPPSTYNRKIPDGLEQIVLRALAKDVEDRFQNAIDLHDELQAFVYQTGEFYSRKDLAGWMKKTFGKEIEDETAKLETYRQLKPPTVETPVVPRTTTRQPTAAANTPPPQRRPTQGMAAIGTKPPPPPSRTSQQLPIVQASASSGGLKSRQEDSGDLAWDEDELETQIYDNPEDDPKNKGAAVAAAVAERARSGSSSKLPLQAPPPPPAAKPAHAAGAPRAAVSSQPMPVVAASTGPDLSSLVSTSKGWESAAAAAQAPGADPSPGATLNGIGGAGNGLNGAKLASGSHKAVVTAPPPPPALPSAAPQLLFDAPREISAGNRLVSSLDKSAPFDPMATFGAGVTQRRTSDRGNKKGILMIAVGGAVVAGLAVAAVVLLTKDPTSNAPTPASGISPTTTAGADENTGFDLYVKPAGITQWKLDGESRTDKLPSQIRNIPPGLHRLQIDPPPGFLSHTQQVTVEAGKAGRVDIVLKPIEGIVGVFESNPPGAEVSLIVNGERKPVGPSPTKQSLDPRNTYQVLFEKSGYVSVNRPISFTGSLEEKTVVNLEKAGAVTPEKPPIEKPPIKTGGPVTDPTKTAGAKTGGTKTGGTKTGGTKTAGDVKTGGEVTTGGEVKTGGEGKTGGEVKPAAKGQGILSLGAKPPCEIYIDGANSGLHTPQREIKLSAGKHKITLVNNEFGIRETFYVEIKADQTEKLIKDFSDRLPK
jgi:serine/threonine protein kinase